MTSNKWLLKTYLPFTANNYCFQLWKKHRFQLRITAPRITKLGDYRFRASQKSHMITINRDLNPYAFLVVYLHEVAHCLTTIKHGLKIRPHGPQWQQELLLLLTPLIGVGVFPDDIEEALRSYLRAPKAANCSHPALTRALRKYDPPSSQVALDLLPESAEFIFQSRRYRKMKVRRTKVACLETAKNRTYLISKLALVQPIGTSSIENRSSIFDESI